MSEAGRANEERGRVCARVGTGLRGKGNVIERIGGMRLRWSVDDLRNVNGKRLESKKVCFLFFFSFHAKAATTDGVRGW